MVQKCGHSGRESSYDDRLFPPQRPYSATACSSAAGIQGTPATRFDALALGNIDADTTVDQWSISSDSRVFSGGGNCTADTNNPSGEPANDQNDVNL